MMMNDRQFGLSQPIRSVFKMTARIYPPSLRG